VGPEAQSVDTSHAFGSGLPDSADLSVPRPLTDDQYFGENHALWVWDEQHGIGFHLYLKTLGHIDKYRLRRETINVHLPDGTVLMSEQDGPGTVDPRVARGSNLECECIEPFERWEFRYDATAQATSAAEMRAGLLRYMPLTPLAFSLETVMVAPALTTETYVKRPQWTSGDFDEVRYEQLLHATGTVTTAAGEFEVSGGGMRTHRVGKRNTGILPGHSWQTATFSDGRAFSSRRWCGIDGVSQWEESFVEKDGVRVPAKIVAAPVFSGALPGEPFEIQLESELGVDTIQGVLRATNFVTVMMVENFRFCFGVDRSDDTHRIMSQGLAAFTWDGQPGEGMIERSVRVHEFPGR
jgi:hypothetical protein